MRATLDCTSGWYSRQDWSGVPVSALLRSTGRARSLLVHPVTGYWIRFPWATSGVCCWPPAWAGLPVRRTRIPAAPGRARPARVLVGEVGRPHRTADDTLVVATAIPGDLGSEGNPGSVVDEAKPRGQAGVVEGAGEVVASFAEAGPAALSGPG